LLTNVVALGSTGAFGRQELVSATTTAYRLSHSTALRARPRSTAATARLSSGTPSILSNGPLFGADEASAQPAIANSLDVQWTRIPFIWSYVQQTGPASWNPFVLSAKGSDTVINSELANGRSIVGLLLGSPTWAAKYPSFGRASVPINIDRPWSPPASDNPTTQKSWPANTNYWANYCYWMAKHYAGRIDT
jgi:hypothetical protein